MTKKQLLAFLNDFSDEMPFFINVDGENEIPLRRSMFVLADDFRSVTLDLTAKLDGEDDEEEEDEAEDDADSADEDDDADINAAVERMRQMLGQVKA